MIRHVLDIDDLSADEVRAVLDLAQRPVSDVAGLLTGRGAALVFEKPSARTRSSTEMAVVALGGHPVMIGDAEVGIDRRETAEDVARTLACYHSVICARVLDHRTLERMASALGGAQAETPVVNLLSDLAHPCQALADLLTIKECFGSLDGRVLAYVGDANNVWRSLALGCALVGVEFHSASPSGYGPDSATLDRVAKLGGGISVFEDPAEAVAGSDAVYTDVWTSMGQEREAEQRRADFAGFTVDAGLMSTAAPGAIAMHCLPAHRGEEITAEVMEGPQSRVWRQAANRMNVMRGLLAWEFGGQDVSGVDEKVEAVAGFAESSSAGVRGD